MKFGRVLALRAIPEWRESYVEYKRLKRLLYRLPDPKGGRDDDFSPAVSPEASLSSSASNLMPLSQPLLTGEYADVSLHFFAELEEGLARANELAAAQEETLVSRVQMASVDGQVLSPQELSSLYVLAAKLHSFLSLNFLAVRKIVKKYDKTVAIAGIPPRTPAMMARLEREPFAVARKQVDMLVKRLEGLVPPDGIPALRQAAKDALHISSGTDATTPRLLPLTLSLLSGLIAASLPLSAFADPDQRTAQRCLGVLVTVVGLWLTEALPFFVTALLVPVLIVVAGAVPPEHEAQLKPEIAKRVLNAMFNNVILLVLSGLVAARVVARCQLELRVAAALQRRLETRPRIFILAIMLLGLLLSATISNVTAPVLLLSVVQPLLHEGQTDSAFARALLLGLAFSCNLGGMLTPIASPQNAIALVSLQQVAGADVSFGLWMSVAMPVALLGTAACWLLLLVLIKPYDCVALPKVVFSEAPLTPQKVFSLSAVAAAAVLWAFLSFAPLKNTLGDPAIVGVLLAAVSFGSGFLHKDDFNALPWHLLALIAGGNALGLAVHESGLLEELVSLAFSTLDEESPWLLTVELVGGILVVGVFVSHTVAAIIIMPLVATIGVQMGQPVPLVFCCALACSAAMALPVSSFPNLNSLSAEDDLGGAYLRPAHFLLAGVPATLVAGVLVATVGYVLAVRMLDHLHA